MKILILILGYLLLVAPCQAAEKQPEQEEQALQQLEHQKKEFEKIEKYISRQRREIEHYYRGRLVELKHRTQSEIRLLETAEKTMYTGLAVQAEVAKAVLHINNYGYQAPWYLVAKTERMLELKGERQSYSDCETGFAETIRRFAVARSLITERKNKISAKMEWESINLEKQKEYALTVTLAELEKQLKEDALKPKPKATNGVVTGILYSADRPSAIVDRAIVNEGDKIHGVTVVKIYKNKVVFEKNGKKWEQEVRQTPAAYWK